MRKQADLFSRVVGTMLLAGGLVTAAQAQNPELSLASVSGKPGENVQVRLSLSGAAAQTSAVNVTIKVSAEDAALLGGAITATVASEIGSGFQVQENSDADAGPAVEYRAVLYPAGSPATPPSFNASGTIGILDLTIPVASSAPVGSEIDLLIQNVFETSSDSVLTGLVGISDASGNSVKGAGETVASGGPRAIDKTDGKITVVPAGTSIDFAQGLSGWEAFQAIPTFYRALPTLDQGAVEQLRYTLTAEGVDITLFDQGLFGSFGYFQTGESAVISSGLTPGQVLTHAWTVETNATDPNANPNVRLRAGIDGQTQISEYMEPARVANGQDQGVSVVPTAASGPVDLISHAYLPPNINNGTRDFVLLAFDALSFYPNGQQGNTYTVKKVTYSTFDPAALGAGSVVYSHDFSEGDTDGFQFLANRGVPNPDVPIPGLGSSSTTANGLEVIPEGPPQAGIIAFAFGIWEKQLNQWTVEAGKVYKIEATIASAAPSPQQTNVSRLRVSTVNAALPGLFDFVWSMVIESGGPGTDLTNLPTNSGVTYTGFVQIPDALAGMPILLSFDGYQTRDGFPFGNPDAGWVTQGGVTLKNVTVTSYNR